MQSSKPCFTALHLSGSASELKENVSVTLGGKGAPAENIWPEDEGYPWSGNCPKKAGISPTSLKTNPSNLSVNTGSGQSQKPQRRIWKAACQAVDMPLETDHLPPQLRLYKDMSVLEKGLDTELPVFASNIDAIDLQYQTFTAAGKSAAKSAALPGPRVRDVTSAIPLGIRKLIPAESGILTGTVSPRPPFAGRTGETKLVFCTDNSL